MGIDPGLTGAIAFLSDTSLLCVHDMPTSITLSGKAEVDAYLLTDLIRHMIPNRAVVELLHSMPKQGVASTFSLGRSAGVVTGVLAGLGIPITYIRPAMWKRQAGIAPRASKAASRTLATTLWPEHAHAFRRAKDDGRADAALIARHE